MNTIEYLIKKLEELGISDFFGLPGDYNFNIIQAIENNPKTRWIGCTNELNAGYAADGYARQKGFGALVTTYGVGELSAINAIAGSYAENVPVIHIVGAPSTEILKGKALYHHNFQEPKPYGFMDSFKSVTEASAFINKDSAKIEIDRILKIFIKERKPVYIAIPEDIALKDTQNRSVDYDWISNPDSLDTVVNLIIEKINKSKNPVIVADTLIKRFDAKSEFVDFVNKSKIPVTNFLMGANIINMDNENYIGTYLSKYGNSLAKDRLEKTDCLIAVGAIYGDLNSFGNPLPFKINSHIAIYGTYTYVEGERYDNVKMSDVLRELAKKIGHKNYDIDKQEFGYEQTTQSKDKLTSKYFYPRLQEFLKGEDIIIAETGTIPFGIAPMKLPENSDLHTQLLWCSIGWATAAAFGASIANPKARVILITGDGAHSISAMEIGNMCRYGVKPIIIVINNNGYTVERYLSGKVDSPYNDIMQVDYSKFARAFKGDVWATKVETEDDFDKALRVTQIMDKLCYIEVITDEADMPEIAQAYLAGKPIVQKPKENKNNKKTGKKEEKIADLVISVDKSYETNVHASLKEYEE